MREDEQLLAQKRMRDDGVAESKKITLQTFKTILSSWHIYLCTTMITIFLIETYPAGQSQYRPFCSLLSLDASD